MSLHPLDGSAARLWTKLLSERVGHDPAVAHRSTVLGFGSERAEGQPTAPPRARVPETVCRSAASRARCPDGDGRMPGERRTRSGQSPAVQRPSYDGGVLRRLRIENLVLIREAELELDAGLNAITGETGAGKTILSNAIGLLLGARGRRGHDRRRRRRGVRRGRVRPARRRRARRARRAAPGGRGVARARAPDLRRRPHPRLRLGAQRGARGRRRGRRGAARDERPVRAAPARAARLPARGARRVRRRQPTPSREARRAWRELAAARRAARRADARRGGGRGAARRSCVRSPPTPRASRPGARTSCAPSASGCAT